MSTMVGLSYYSLQYGSMSPAELVEVSIQKGYDRLVLTDIHNSGAALDVLSEAGQHGLQLVLGMQFTSIDGCWMYTAIAQDLSAWQAVNDHFSSRAKDASLEVDVPQLEGVYWIYPLADLPCKSLRNDEYIGLLPWQCQQWDRLRKIPKDKLLAWNLAVFQHRHDFMLHKILRAISQNCLLTQLEENTFFPEDAYVEEAVVREKQYSRLDQVWERTEELLQHVSYPSVLLSEEKNRQTFTGKAQDDQALLYKLSWEGFRERYPQADRSLEDRFRRELEVINRLGFNTYFLITEDIVRYGFQRGFYHVGRGSGANSMVAYCLKITDVDPVALDLYFERFINEHRSSPPDFDIDFSWDERDQVIDYVFKRYGGEYVALLATYTTYQFKSVFRALGQIIGLNEEEIKQLQMKARDLNAIQGNRLFERIYYWASRLENLPSHMSIHPGGMLITQRPLHRYVATQVLPKGFPVIQLDMYSAEDHGFHKYDILSQRGIGHIKEAVRWVRINQQQKIDVHRVHDFINDPKINAELSQGNTLGCFYVESPAMRSLLKKLHCDSYPGLVAASSIIRPGVSRSGMMQAYLERKHDPSKIHYLHPRLGELLKDTFGVMVYQEDVLKVAHHFAGLDLAEGDVLRRGMSGKSRGKDEILRIREKFFSLCKQKGYSEELSQEVWRQIESFSGYSFCKAHSASFAVESYQSLYLRTYFPLEFMLGVINNFGGFYRSEIYFHEARRLGATLHLPCINHSDWLAMLYGKDLYVGFAWVKGIEKKVIKAVMQERKAGGPYLSLAQFVQRVKIGREQLNLLIRVGAFRFSGKAVKELLWEKNQYIRDEQCVATGYLFTNKEPQSSVLSLDSQSRLEQVYEQMDLLGFSLYSPFELVQPPIPQGIIQKDLVKNLNKWVKIPAYFICIKRSTTHDKKMMGFGCWYDLEGNYFDTVHFPQSWQSYPVDNPGCYFLEGIVGEDYGQYYLDVKRLRRLKYQQDPRFK